MAEPADFVHVFDVDSGYEKEQEIDFFGEISGMSFSPDTESLFIGVWDRTYASLLELGRRREYSYLDTIVWGGLWFSHETVELRAVSPQNSNRGPEGV